MSDSIDIDKLLKENRERVIAELRQQDHQLGNGLSHIVAEIGRISESQKSIMDRMSEMDRHSVVVSKGVAELRVSIAGSESLGVRGLGERVKAVEQSTEKTSRRLDAFENRTKGGIWIISALATMGGFVGTFIGLWIKSFKG